MKTAKALVLDGAALGGGSGHPIQTLEARFWSHVDPSSGGCWIWMGRRNVKGYGSFGIGQKKTAPAHRVAWVLVNGPLEATTLVLHSRACVSRACVRPDHLRCGTQKENMADVSALGRWPAHRTNHNTKKTHCDNGHPLSGPTCLITPHRRRCLICYAATAARRDERRRAADRLRREGR